MRIISGKARGTKIDTIDSSSTRPTLDRVKESLFNIIQDRVKNSSVLDLFAGSGALGIEALSRGASKAVLCDSNTEAVKIIKKNLNKTHLVENSEVLCTDYKSCLQILKDRLEKFDIIFMDPPYKNNLAGNAIKKVIYYNLINPNGMIIVETDELARDINEIELLINSKDEKYQKLYISDKRKYGRANLIFLSINEER